MRILFIHTFYTLKGGEDAVFENEMLEMSRTGHAVEALIFSNEKFSIFKLLSLPFNIFAYRQTRERIRSFRPDIVHIHNFHFAASPSVIRAIGKEGIPCVMTLHNFRLICPSATLFHRNTLYLFSLKQKFPWTAVFDGVYRNSVLITFWLSLSNWMNRLSNTWKIVDQFIIPNRYASKLFEASAPAIFKNRITVKANYFEDAKRCNPARGEHFLFVGRLNEEKGLLTLLKAQKTGRFKLTIIGDGPLRNQVEEHAKSNHGVCYLGFQGKDVILEEMSKAAALILPSVCMEMNPLTMIEAFSCSTPVIAADVPTLQEFIVDEYNGWQFKASDPASLNRAIESFSSLDADWKNRLCANARSTFEAAFTKEKHVNAIHRIYAKLLEPQRQS
jgi:glycosyltransferase involved in cell wall biosynthesis